MNRFPLLAPLIVLAAFTLAAPRALAGAKVGDTPKLQFKATDGTAVYTVLATAVSGTSQAGDTRCRVLGARMTGGNILRGSSQSTIDWAAANPDSGNCWAR